MAEAVKLADILSYLKTRCGQLECPFCKGKRFRPAGDGDNPIALLYENSGRSWFGPPGYLRVYALACENCSFVGIFELAGLERWVAETKRSVGG